MLDVHPGRALNHVYVCNLPVLCLKDSLTDQRFDALQNQVAGDVARQILAQLSDQFGVALILLS